MLYGLITYEALAKVSVIPEIFNRGYDFLLNNNIFPLKTCGNDNILGHLQEPLIRKINLSRFFIILLTAYCLLFTTSAYAAIQSSLSVVTGYYYPRLYDLNYLLKLKEVELGPRNTEAKPTSYPVIYQGYSPEGMPKMRATAPKFGLQFQVDLNPRYSVFIGNSIATYDSTKRDVRKFFVGFEIPSNRVTRFSLSLNQIWAGLKRNWVFGDKGEEKGRKREAKSQKAEKIPSNPPSEKGGAAGFDGEKPPSRIYVETGILTVTRAFLTTDVWLHVYAPEEGFDFYKVTETESTGNGFAAFLGAGGEYFIKRWVSLGMDADYTIGGVANLKFTKYFTIDPLEKDIIKPGDKVVYTDLRLGRRGPLFIDLAGWDLKGQVRFYF